ncbi:MAG: hypothetical protein Q9181_001508 [Wetmoreana brouardii]
MLRGFAARRSVIELFKRKKRTTEAEIIQAIKETRAAVPKPGNLPHPLSLINPFAENYLEGAAAAAEVPATKVASINQPNAAADKLQSTAAHNLEGIETTTKPRPKPLVPIHATSETETEGITFPAKPAKAHKAHKAARRSTTKVASINQSTAATDKLQSTAVDSSKRLETPTEPGTKSFAPKHGTSKTETEGITFPARPAKSHTAHKAARQSTTEPDNNKQTTTAAAKLPFTAAPQPKSIKTTIPGPKPLIPPHQPSEISTAANQALSLQVKQLSSQLHNLQSQMDDTNKELLLARLEIESLKRKHSSVFGEKEARSLGKTSLSSLSSKNGLQGGATD